MKSEELVEIRRDVCLALLKDYYRRHGRTVTPDYHSYSTYDLKKCLHLFKIPYPDGVETKIVSAESKRKK